MNKSTSDVEVEPPATNLSPLRLIAIHLGASNSLNNERHENLAKSICESIMDESRREISLSGESNRKNSNCYNVLCQETNVISEPNTTSRKSLISTAVEAVVRAVELMENEKGLNCGLGSSLSMQGLVECDASVMSSVDQIWTGVGAVTGCRNPIRLANSLRDHATISRPLGLVQPNFLVASGAKQWMREHCPTLIVPDSHLISSSALSNYQNLKSNFDLHRKNRQISKMNCDLHDVTDCDNSTVSSRLDTVGAVAVDCYNNFACAISSGGIMLKHRGRIGQAALPGAGCWAQDSMAITTTGVGEYLTTTLFAKKFHDKLQTLRLLHDLGKPSEPTSAETRQDQALSLLIREAMNQCFKDLVDSPALGHVPLSERLAGMLAVSSLRTNLTNRHQVEPERQNLANELKLCLSYGHNTRSLCIGYMLSSDTRAVSFVSRNDVSVEEKTQSGSASPQSNLSLRTIVLDCSWIGSNKTTIAN